MYFSNKLRSRKKIFRFELLKFGPNKTLKRFTSKYTERQLYFNLEGRVTLAFNHYSGYCKINKKTLTMTRFHFSDVNAFAALSG